MKEYIANKVVVILSVIMLSACTAAESADTSVNLTSLLEDAQALNTKIIATTLSPQTLCSDLSGINSSAVQLLGKIEGYTATLIPAPVDTNTLQSLDDLSTEFVKMADNSTALSLSLTALNSTTEQLAIRNAMNAMLRLSDDIGTMAGRILEMSDKILVMADNIGLMADRIIITQQIQSENLALTQSSILATQSNAIALANVVNSSVYNPDLDAQKITGNSLAATISGTVLTQQNMVDEWLSIATDVNALKNQIEASYASIKSTSSISTQYIDISTLSLLSDLSTMVSALSSATNSLSLDTQSLASTTSSADLSNSIDSMLLVSTDIGVMADRILEMADLILVMADNIGLTANQIVATQQTQSTNYVSTLQTIEATQSVIISIIAANSL